MKNLYEIIKGSLDAYTVYDNPTSWQVDFYKDNPMIGQCVVATLVVNDYLGGDIRCSPDPTHYWNLLPDGTEVDLTVAQFKGKFTPSYIVTHKSNEIREELMDICGKRYKLLKSRVESKL